MNRQIRVKKIYWYS